MVLADDAIAKFKADFLALIKDCERFSVLCRSSPLQNDCAAKLRSMGERAGEIKARAVKAVDEDAANELLAYEFMLDALANELEMYVALKAELPGEAWTHLVNAQMAAAGTVKSHAAAAHLERAYVPRLHWLEQLLFPKQKFMSAGYITEESECSICGAIYGECDHIKGRPYMGQLCARIVKKAKLQEVSLVDEPADKHCRIISFTDDDGVKRDPLSLEPVNDEKIK